MACNEKITNPQYYLDYHQEPEEDVLSFCDLPILNNVKSTEQNKSTPSPPSEDDEDEDLFEFLISPQAEPPKPTIVFCGKPIGPAKQPSEFPKQPRNGVFNIRKESFKKCLSYNYSRSDTVSGKKLASPCGANHSSSFWSGSGPKKGASSPATASYRYSRNGNGGSWKHKVTIGLVMKLQPEMELSEIRKRQRRRSPAPMFPATSGAGKEIRTRSRWGILRPLWCRAHFMSALTKASFGSFGCLSHA